MDGGPTPVERPDQPATGAFGARPGRTAGPGATGPRAEPTPGAELRLDLGLSLPRDAVSVPLVRHLCGHALREVGATAECILAVELAVTEACANVLEHAGPTEGYQVSVELADRRCIICVIDEGPGFDLAGVSGDVDADAEGGRGVNLMRMLVESVHFTAEPQVGAIVRLVKLLDFEPDAPARRLMP